MDKELDKKLVEAFPLLYADRHRSMQETSMCWGFPGNGWYELLYDLSSKLEPIIEKIAEDLKHGKCYNCGCGYWDHRHMPSGKRLCTKVHKLPYRVGGRRYGTTIPQWGRDMVQAWTNEWNYKKPDKYKVSKHGRARRLWSHFKKLLKQDWGYTTYRNLDRGVYRRINQVLRLLSKIGLRYKKPCKCTAHEIQHPRASQVKEKFGTLRFYMSTGNDEIWKLIREAEKKSGETCEECGSEGSRRGGGWIRTLCDLCAKKNDQEITQEEWLKQMKASGHKMFNMMSLTIKKEIPTE